MGGGGKNIILVHIMLSSIELCLVMLETKLLNNYVCFLGSIQYKGLPILVKIPMTNEHIFFNSLFPFIFSILCCEGEKYLAAICIKISLEYNHYNFKI